MPDDPLRQLLLAAARDPAARQDAVAALLLRTIWIATWKPRSRAFRTLINAQNQEALAVFTDEPNLDQASEMLGWSRHGVHVDRETLQGERLFRYVKKHNLPFLVVDVASNHALELTRNDIDQCLRDMTSPPPATSKPPRATTSAPAAGSAPAAPAKKKRGVSIVELPSMAPSFDMRTGAYGAAMDIPSQTKVPDLRGIVKSGPLHGFRAQTRPPPASIELDLDIFEATQPELKRPPASPPTAPPAARKPVPQTRRTQQPPPAKIQRVSELPPAERLSQIPPGYELAETPNKKLPDSLLQYMRKFLGGYPEVEWAAHCQLRDTTGNHHDTVAIRLTDNYRQNLIGIAAEVRSSGNKEGVQLTVLVVDDPQNMRKARDCGVMFYPWRK